MITFVNICTAKIQQNFVPRSKDVYTVGLKQDVGFRDSVLDPCGIRDKDLRIPHTSCPVLLNNS